jgi:hypothetical protein
VKIIPALLAMAVSAVAASTDPGETAVRFLEKVRDKEINLDPGADTALSPQTSSSKRKQIARRLERMARDLGTDPLEVGAVKLDGELAGVLVRKISGFDPNRMQVFPVALVKRGAEWAVAPVPASFENSGVGYAAALRKRLNALEDWMLREQVLDLAKLRDQSADRMRRKIEESLPLATLQSLDSLQTANRFLKACETRNLPEIHGLLGGLATTPPSNWPLRIKAAESAMAAGQDVPPPWRLLVSKDVLRMIVLHEEDAKSAMVSIACLDPAGGKSSFNASASQPRVQLVHLELSKTKEGTWRVDPPQYFLQGIENPDGEADDELDADLLDAFTAKVSEALPATPKATAGELQHTLTTTLQTGDLASLMPLIRLDGGPMAALASCVRAARLWWALREPSTPRRIVPLGIHEQDDSAATSFQIFSARNPDRLNLKILYFEKSKNGWLWTPNPGLKSEKLMRDWTNHQAGKWLNQWQQSLLAECPELDKIPETDAPSEEASRTLIESWFQAIHDEDIIAALKLTTRLNLPDSEAVLLRNLGYEFTAARKSKRPPTIREIHRGDHWAAAGTRTDFEGKPTCPLYPIVATPSGPRILLEVDLSVSGERSRDYLNKTTLERLKRFDEATAKELKKLFLQHQTTAKKPQ